MWRHVSLYPLQAMLNAVKVVLNLSLLTPSRSLGRTLLAKEQARIRQQYEERLRELEVERQGLAEDKAQASCSCGLMAWGAGQPS